MHKWLNSFLLSGLKCGNSPGLVVNTFLTSTCIISSGESIQFRGARTNNFPNVSETNLPFEHLAWRPNHLLDSSTSMSSGQSKDMACLKADLWNSTPWPATFPVSQNPVRMPTANQFLGPKPRNHYCLLFSLSPRVNSTRPSVPVPHSLKHFSPSLRGHLCLSHHLLLNGSPVF